MSDLQCICKYIYICVYVYISIYLYMYIDISLFLSIIKKIIYIKNLDINIRLETFEIDEYILTKSAYSTTVLLTFIFIYI